MGTHEVALWLMSSVMRSSSPVATLANGYLPPEAGLLMLKARLQSGRGLGNHLEIEPGVAYGHST
jgi:hypothetical protein